MVSALLVHSQNVLSANSYKRREESDSQARTHTCQLLMSNAFVMHYNVNHCACHMVTTRSIYACVEYCKKEGGLLLDVKSEEVNHGGVVGHASLANKFV